MKRQRKPHLNPRHPIPATPPTASLRLQARARAVKAPWYRASRSLSFHPLPLPTSCLACRCRSRAFPFDRVPGRFPWHIWGRFLLRAFPSCLAVCASPGRLSSTATRNAQQGTVPHPVEVSLEPCTLHNRRAVRSVRSDASRYACETSNLRTGAGCGPEHIQSS